MSGYYIITLIELVFTQNVNLIAINMENYIYLQYKIECFFGKNGRKASYYFFNSQLKTERFLDLATTASQNSLFLFKG